MAHPNDRTEKRKRRSPSPASSSSPGPSRSNAQITLYSDRRSNKRQRREEYSPDATAVRIKEHTVGEDVARAYARAHYANAHDLRVTDQHQGHHFEGVQAHDSARVHNGNHYGPVNNYNYTIPDTGQRTQEQSQKQLEEHRQKELEEHRQRNIALAMKSLRFSQMDNRQANIRRAYASTCSWILDKTEYKNWRDADLTPEHNGFFWIKSKPGAGKSTLMKFFVQSADLQLPGDHIISFFFNARGESLERSLEGLYRGLLRQLLTAVPRLQKVLEPLAGANSTPEAWHEAWHLDNLKTLFSEAVMKLGKDRVTCFIDALDECPEAEIRDMIDFFEELGESTSEADISLRMCFSSRHYPQVTMMKCQQMVLDGQDGHEDDIARFVESKLKVRGGKQAQEVRTAVQAKAKGVFIWVVLVVRILNAESDRGISNAKLRTCLDRIPAELHDLFQDILQRGIQDNKYLLPILQWISFAQRPLTREELYFAVRSGSTDFVASQPWDPEEDDAGAMELFILDSSKGLAEMTKGETPTIQFIHESVRDYLHDTGFAALAPELSGNLLGLTHDYLKRCCLNFITEPILSRLSLPEPLPKANSAEAEGFREQASKWFPFLQYATENLISHAELAIGNGVDQFGSHAATWLSETLWRPFTNLFAIHDSGRHPPGISATSIFVHCSAVHLLRHACDPLHPHEFAPILSLAIQSENIHLVTALLDTMNDLVPAVWTQLSNEEGTNLLFRTGRMQDATFFHALLESGIAIPEAIEDLLLEIAKFGSAQAIIHLSAKGAKISLRGASTMDSAIHRGNEDVVQVLIDLGLTPETYLEAYSVHPLVTASQVGQAGIVRILLMNRTYASAPTTIRTSLSAACSRGHSDVLRLLLDFGAPVNHSDMEGGTLLNQACKQGSLPVVQLLLEHGALVNALDSQEGTPLNLALKRRNLPVVQLLLNHGALVSLLDPQDGAVLMFAACKCRHLPIVQQLLDHGADVNLGDGWQTPLAVACELGEVSIVQALLAGGADPDPEGYPPPLSLLFYRLDIGWSGRFPRAQGIAIARLLLDNSANPNVICASSDYSEALFTREQQQALSRTLMYGASVMGDAELLRLLFEKGANATVRDGKEYHDALEVSCRDGHEEVVKVLLANGASVAYRECEYYRGVVEQATENRHGRIVRLLLTESHGFCAQNRNLYSGSLRVALEKGYDETANVLMDRGVELSGPEMRGSSVSGSATVPFSSHMVATNGYAKAATGVDLPACDFNWSLYSCISPRC